MKAILIDDEILALEYLEELLGRIGTISIEGKFNYFDPKIHRELIEEIDVVFLDMEMPNLHGLNLADELLLINDSLLIIFVTAYNHFASEAFELSVFDYVLKPINLDRLRKTCERIEATISSPSAPSNTKDGSLVVHVGGELTFELFDGTIMRPEWRTSKVKELFLYLLHKRGRSVQKSELTELLWPDIQPDISYPRLYTLIYHIRKTILPYKENLVIESTDEGYTLNLLNAYIDLYEWERQIELFHELHPDNVHAFEKAMELYQGAYLEKYVYIWAEAERFRLEQLFLEQALKIAQYHEQQENIQQAVNWYINICSSHPDYEEATFSLLKALDKLGNYPLVIYYFEQLKKAADDLQIKIGQEIDHWYSNWMKQHLQ